MEADRIKWNQRFASKDSYLGSRPSPFLIQEIDRILRLVPGNGALDVACGEGRNSVFLAQHGFQVTGLDISDVGLEKAKGIAKMADVQVDFYLTDLDEYTFKQKYDLIINFNFLKRDLIPSMVAALTPGGLLLFDTLLASPQLLAHHNPAFLLQQGELQDLFTACAGDILVMEECDQGDVHTARLLFRSNKESIHVT